jgi:hypothetical protein
MPIYIFHLCRRSGVSFTFETRVLANDSESFTCAGLLLDEHLSCDHVDVFEGDRPVVARHRLQPVIRPIDDAPAAAHAH